MKINELSDGVRMPRTLYTTSEIREYFNHEYDILSRILSGYGSQTTIQNDWGVWYDVILLPATPSQSKRLKLSKTKLGKDRKPLRYL